jgi:siroheme synthase
LQKYFNSTSNNNEISALIIEIKRKTREAINNVKTKKAMNYLKLRNVRLKLGRPWVMQKIGRP